MAGNQLPNRSAEYSHDIRQFSRFLVVGFSNFAISFAVFYLLYNYWQVSTVLYALLGQAGNGLEGIVLGVGASSLDASLANMVGYAAGVINSFIWNKLWTFKAKHETAAQFGRFLILNLACLLLSSACLFLFTDYLGWSYLPVWFVTMGFVTLLNFVISKSWVFGSSSA
jgi:putative flippase GtrA